MVTNKKISSWLLHLMISKVQATSFADLGFSGNGFINLPVDSVSLHPSASSLATRDAPPSANISDAFFVHLIPIGIGTPAQIVTPVIDTGSFDLWVNPDCKFAPDSRLCSLNLPYNASNSSTAVRLNDTEQTYSYAPGGRVQVIVSFVNDSLKIGDASLSVHKFGVARTSRGVSTGILGLGPHPNPDIGFSNSSGFGGVVAGMVREGLINTRAYSLMLGTAETTYGLSGNVISLP
jgi:hypothetical protein